VSDLSSNQTCNLGSTAMTLPYKVTWFHFDPKDDTKSVSREADTFAEALELIPHGPVGWQRYRITQGRRFVERGDPVGVRGAPAIERFRPQ
jgi:hypothetical protein